MQITIGNPDGIDPWQIAAALKLDDYLDVDVTVGDGFNGFPANYLYLQNRKRRD